IFKIFYFNDWYFYSLKFADKITTVSPTYAREIRTEYYGEGLHDVLNSRAGDLIGILNGVNYEEWSPEVDKFISPNYSQKTLDNKRKIKYEFLKSNGIYDNLDIPLVGMITRLTEQKGIDLVMNKLEEFLWNARIRFVMLGTGEARYQDYFNYIKDKYPNNSIVYIGYNEAFSHQVYAASDFLLVPSKFEPCGLTQMYAMRYGTLPIVRATGGLSDTVHEFTSQTKTGSGFVFWNYNADDFAYALDRALQIYSKPKIMDKARKCAMQVNFSSERSAKQYIDVFNWALEKIRY
ncbi:MAG: glycogen synthase, partial [Bacteroidetes bacterium]|nr:glycogen synthase [Bacteroidota bacterium]